MIQTRSPREIAAVLCLAATVAAGGCRSAQSYRKDADRVAYGIIEQKQRELGTHEPVVIQTAEQQLRRRLMLDQDVQRSGDASLSGSDVAVPKNWPEDAPRRPAQAPSATDQSRYAPLALSMLDALKIAARNSREYQAEKEQVFISALNVDLRRNDFGPFFSGSANTTVASDQATGQSQVSTGAGVGVSQRLRNGAVLAGHMGIDVVKLLTGSHDSSSAFTWDSTVTMPLLAGSGEAIVLEPLTQAERSLAYALFDFSQYRRQFAVSVASQYLSVLSQYDQIKNAEDAYRRAIDSTLRARRQADAGRLPEIQVDQSLQQELRSRERWIQAQASFGRRLDAFKVLLGLPPDVNIVLDPAELKRMSEITQRVTRPAAKALQQGDDVAALTGEAADQSPATNPVTASTIQLPASDLRSDGSVPQAGYEAVALALKHRPDLQIAAGNVFDAQRKAIVAADALRAGLTLTGSARSGRGSGGSGGLSAPLDEARYEGGLLLNLPLERTAERNAYRISLIAVESAIRAFQSAEDNVKQSVRNDIRDLLLGRETIAIQADSVAVAEKRVASTNLFLEAGRAQVRDVLEAQDALVQAQNALTAALVGYRVAELSLQRDTGMLEIDQEGMWKEYKPLLTRSDSR